MGDILWKYVGAGADMTCGLDLNGKAYCWGTSMSYATGKVQSQSVGQLGLIDGDWTFTSLSVGWDQGACGVLTTREAVCWGSNRFGQTGTGPANDGRLPAVVPTTARFSATGRTIYASCGITEAGAPYCWGSNATGLLGVPDSTLPDLCLSTHCSAQPLEIASSVPLVPASLSVGTSHACALNQVGDVYCWGNGGANNGQASPVVPLTTGKTFTQLVTAGNNYCGIASDEKTYCWGNNNYGQTGTGTAGADIATPMPVSGNFHFTKLAAGVVNLCAVEVNGRIYCWGNNLEKQVGDGTTDDRWVPTLVRSFN
jgi:alpha-tubulin suppressor-like RCC1 family protein